MRRRRDFEYGYVDDTPSLRQRLGRFMTLLGVVFTVVAAVVVVQRLSDDTLALIIGLLLAGAPLSVVIGLLVYLLTRRTSTQRQPSSQQMTIPPVIVQLPPQSQTPTLPDHGVPWDDSTPRTTSRQWEVIGGEE